MTKHMTSTDLINALTDIGMRVFDDSNIRGIFESLDQATVSEAQIMLMRHGYVFADCTFNDSGCYEFSFDAPEGVFPNPLVLRYMHSGYSRIFMALCYEDGGELRQFTRPYQWWAPDVTGRPAQELLAAFKYEFGDRQYHWIPILRFSPFAKQ